MLVGRQRPSLPQKPLPQGSTDFLPRHCHPPRTILALTGLPVKTTSRRAMPIEIRERHNAGQPLVRAGGTFGLPSHNVVETGGKRRIFDRLQHQGSDDPVATDTTPPRQENRQQKAAVPPSKDAISLNLNAERLRDLLGKLPRTVPCAATWRTSSQACAPTSPRRNRHRLLLPRGMPAPVPSCFAMCPAHPRAEAAPAQR